MVKTEERVTGRRKKKSSMVSAGERIPTVISLPGS